MPGFVLDASVTLAYVLPDESVTDAVRDIMRRARTEPVFVPCLWSIEVGNALVIRCRKNRLTPEEAERVLAKPSQFNVHAEEASGTHHWSRGFQLALAHSLTLYDAIYLEIASRLRLPLATFDKALRRAAEAEGVPILPA